MVATNGGGGNVYLASKGNGCVCVCVFAAAGMSHVGFNERQRSPSTGVRSASALLCSEPYGAGQTLKEKQNKCPFQPPSPPPSWASHTMHKLSCSPWLLRERDSRPSARGRLSAEHNAPFVQPGEREADAERGDGWPQAGWRGPASPGRRPGAGNAGCPACHPPPDQQPWGGEEQGLALQPPWRGVHTGWAECWPQPRQTPDLPFSAIRAQAPSLVPRPPPNSRGPTLARGNRAWLRRCSLHAPGDPAKLPPVTCFLHKALLQLLARG